MASSWARALKRDLRPEPSEPPRRFAEPAAGELADKLADAPSEMLLSEAEALFAEPQARIESVERRATTLQGGVAIAATVALTGGGLVLDPTKLQGLGWRIAFASGLALLVLALVLTGARALSASSRSFAFRAPADSDQLMKRAGSTDRDAYARERAAWLLWAYGRNNEIAAVKVEYLWKAAFWFRVALAVLAALMLLVVAYVLAVEPATVTGQRP